MEQISQPLEPLPLNSYSRAWIILVIFRRSGNVETPYRFQIDSSQPFNGPPGLQCRLKIWHGCGLPGQPVIS
jgi:hypothetical protein